MKELNLLSMKSKIGQVIKSVVERENVKVTELSKAIGVSRNNIYDIYERTSIDTDLLKRIGQFLNYDFFQHFLEDETVEKLKSSNKIISSKILVEIELNDDEIMKIGFNEKVLKILNK